MKTVEIITACITVHGHILTVRDLKSIRFVTAAHRNIHLIQKWPPFKYSFVPMQIGPYGLVQG